MLGCVCGVSSCDADGLCYPAACGDDADCPDGRECFHAVCLWPCDAEGGCLPGSKCISDEGHRFCADSDGLPVEPCPVSM